VTVGEFGRVDLKAAVDIPIVEGKVDAKVAALSQSMDGYFTNSTTGQDLGEDDVLAVRPMIRFTPTESFDLTLIGEYHRNKSDLMPGQNYSPDKLLCILQDFCGAPLGEVDEFDVAMTDFGAGFIDAEIWGITVDMNWDVGPGTITWISNYRDTDEFIDIDGDMTVTDFFRISRDQPHEQYSTELRFASTAWENFDFIAGVYFFHQEYRMEQNFFLGIGPPGTPVAHLINNTGQDHDSYSVFAEGNYHVTDKLTLILGGRWSKDEKDFFAEALGPFPTPGPILNSPSESWNDFGPKAGIRYQFMPDLMTYFTYTRGFKSGGFNGRCAQALTCEKSFDPEEVDGFEAGLKADFLDNRLRTNLALFWNEYDDLQRTVIIPLPGAVNANETVTENAASATIRGVELEVSALPVEGLQIDVGVGYLDAEYDEFCADLDGPEPGITVPVSECGAVISVGDLDGDGVEDFLVEQDLSNLSLQRAPEWNLTTNLTYEFPVANGGNIVLNGRYSYVDELFTDQLELSPRGSVNLVDASISYVDSEGRYRLSLFGLNLTDEVYVSARNLAANLWTTRFVNAPRRWGVELSFDF
jgi:iron complex outermembrane receptor protein